MTIASNTIVKNGMPYIGDVLRQVAPLVDRMDIALSLFSRDDTYKEILKVMEEFPKKIYFSWEGTARSALLTEVRNIQVQRSKEDWILFLDDDDWWETDTLKKCLEEIKKDGDKYFAYSVTPWQLLDAEHYDVSWKNKSFSKFLRNKDLCYKGAYPEDMPTDKEGRKLYWKKHPLVKTLPHRFYHLSYLKKYSFRNEPWARGYAFYKGEPAMLPEPFPGVIY